MTMSYFVRELEIKVDLGEQLDISLKKAFKSIFGKKGVLQTFQGNIGI